MSKFRLIEAEKANYPISLMCKGGENPHRTARLTLGRLRESSRWRLWP